jgi:hypothetical protein
MMMTTTMRCRVSPSVDIVAADLCACLSVCLLCAYVDDMQQCADVSISIQQATASTASWYVPRDYPVVVINTNRGGDTILSYAELQN